ncbi:type IV pilus modification protein PilV [Dyella silvae]|uniref:type IV pilus modification protein PilV n=1 Tax=Dyella silvae TaxID=2994424 RepID=UPI00226411A8|nr:type IV pilus modification protein PilV [Dyella silvae]
MKHQRGMLMIEVLISIFIAAIALLGMIGLSMKSSHNQMESFQRVQALTLVQDMVSRMNANRQVAACYSDGATGTVTTQTLPSCTVNIVATSTAAQQAMVNADLAAWQSELRGASEVNGTTNVGAMIGATGCIAQTDPVNNIYRITVAWQGLTSTVAPTLTCGKGNFGTNDALRRAVSVKIQIGNLTS